MNTIRILLRSVTTPAKFLQIWLLLLLPFTAFARYEDLLHKTFTERNPRLDDIQDKAMLLGSSEAMAILSELKTTAEKNDDRELTLQAEMMETWYRLCHDTAHWKMSRYEPSFLSLLEKAHAQHYACLEIYACNEIGYFDFNNARKYPDAFKYYLKMDRLLEDISTAVLYKKSEYIYNIGNAYYQFGDYEKARIYLQKALLLERENKSEAWVSINTNNTLGLIYRNNGAYDSAIYFFRQAQEGCRTAGLDGWFNIAGGNIGITYFLQQKYAAAVPLLEADVAVSLKEKAFDNAVNSMLKLAEIDLIQKNVAEATAQLSHIQQLLPSLSRPEVCLPDYYRLLAQLNASEGKYSDAYRYSELAGIAKDTLHVHVNAQMLLREEQKSTAAQYESTVQSLQAKADMQQIIYTVLLIGLVLVSVIFGLLASRQRSRQKMQQAQNALAKQELATSVRTIHDFTKQIHEKNTLIEKITAELEQHRPAVHENISSNILIDLQQSILLTEEQWNEFRQNFEKVYNGFFERLKEKLPDLTPAETRFMALSKLNLSSKEMAGMLGITTQGVRNYRYRLRKKLNLPEDGSIDELVSII